MEGSNVRFHASFRRMDESTADEWSQMEAQDDGLIASLPDRLLEQLRLLDSDASGFAVDRLTHSLQTAARAEQDGRDDAYLISALLHDIGDVLSPLNHADVAAAIVKPWVPNSYHWMVQHHGIFQGYYFWHYLGGNRYAREELRDHEYYECGEEFVRKYDMLAFDPEYSTPPLKYYEPLLRGFLIEHPD